ncbi:MULTISPECIES: DUF6245 family protein [Streptosporangium]
MAALGMYDGTNTAEEHAEEAARPGGPEPYRMRQAPGPVRIRTAPVAR